MTTRKPSTTRKPWTGAKHAQNATQLMLAATGLARLDDMEDITKSTYDAGYEETLRLIAALLMKVQKANTAAADAAAKLAHREQEISLLCVDDKARAEWKS
ncbi:hypothetical protein [Arthrobacter psychrochitiniphilus]|uniref:hypothetical protein n=1 Tax=Arthrobacter psychrochitiniphilus TaxID=291045 RepID=UPI003F7B3F92